MHRTQTMLLLHRCPADTAKDALAQCEDVTRSATQHQDVEHPLPICDVAPSGGAAKDWQSSDKQVKMAEMLFFFFLFCSL